jgi:hypothetical protein
MDVIYHVKWMVPNEKTMWLIAQDVIQTNELSAIIGNLIDKGAVIISVEPVVPR